MRLKMLFLFPLLLPLWAAAGTPAKKPPPPPYIFNLGGLSARQTEALKKVPGVVKVAPHNGRVRVVWQPFNDMPWESWKKWIDGAEQIYDFLVLKDVLGKTRWTHGARSNKRAGTIMTSALGGSVCFSMKFNDAATGHNEIMRLECYSLALPGQVEHEMLRDVPGTRVTIEKCGPGYAVVSRAGRGVFVVWQVSEQMFVRIDNSYDKEMVAAYVKRLGSITPKDYKISVDKWVENEIRWRVMELDHRYKRRIELKLNESLAWTDITFLQITFPSFPRPKHKFLPRNATLFQEWEHLYFARYWLWANRKNFKYDDRGRGYILKGKDLYDPEHPPELPPELRPPPKPKEVRKPTPTKKPAPAKTP